MPSARLADADSPVVELRIFATPDGDAVELLIEQPAAASATHRIRSTLRMLYLALGSSEQAIVPQAWGVATARSGAERAKGEAHMNR